MELNETFKKAGEKISDIVPKVRSQLAYLAMATLVCNAVFAVCAVAIDNDKDLQAFIFSIHMFLTVVGLFGLIVLWCPLSLYHPSELKDVEKEKCVNRPWVPTVILFAGLILYMTFYLIITLNG